MSRGRFYLGRLISDPLVPLTMLSLTFHQSLRIVMPCWMLENSWRPLPP